MRLIRNHPEARWLPSRCRFAMFRLLAWIRLSYGNAADEVPTAYVIDREQDAFENFAVSAFFFVTAGCYLSAALQQWLVLPAAIALAIFLVPVVAELPFFAIGLVVMPIWRRLTGLKEGTNEPAASFGTMVLVFAASVWFAWNAGWAKVPAIAALSLFALNALSAIVLLPLRKRIAEREARCAS